MSLKFKYILFIGVLHLALVALIYVVLKEQISLFIASEILVLISLFLSYQLYHAFIKPLSLVQSGSDAIADGDFNIKYIHTNSLEINRLIDVFNAMIDQLREERTAMSAQSYFVQNLIQSTPLGIIIMDLDGAISNVNPAARQILDIPSSWQGKSLDEHPSELSRAIASVLPGSKELISINGRDKYKVQVEEVIHQGFKRRFIILDDLSLQLLQSEKEAYGRIIRMMAHEVNNSMGAINSILDSVVEFGLKGEEEKELKDSILVARERNVALNRFMANFASILRLPEPQITKLDLALVVKKNSQLYLPAAREAGIDLRLDIPLEPISVFADATLLGQAISNILKNALEAAEEKGKQVRVICRSKPALFIIADNGEGISREVEKQLFSPFFSTKPKGQGVGLMLVRQILQDHRCTFSLKTHPDGWTRFEVRF